MSPVFTTKKKTEQFDEMDNVVADPGVSSSPTIWEAVTQDAAAPETVEIVDSSEEETRG